MVAGRRGRPRGDRLDLLERIAPLLVEDPGLSANEVQLAVGGRRADVLRCVRIVRETLRADQRPSAPPSRFPKGQSGLSGGGSA
jgi:hypothetical protein